MPRYKRSSWSTRLSTATHELATLGLKIGAVLLVVVVAYLIWAFHSGAVSKLAQMSPADRKRAAETIALPQKPNTAL